MKPRSNKKKEVIKWDNNMKRLDAKFKAKEDFFIMGKIGWGKTSIIKDLAEKNGYEVITVNLINYSADDLGGNPIAGKKRKTGRAKAEALMPEFGQYIKDNPEQKFLLFFDDLGYVAPDVLNAVMTIIREHKICGEKFDNFIVGAAGNFECEIHENGELNSLLPSFSSLMAWESDTPEAWENAFNYMHEKWDDIVPKWFINGLAEIAYVFGSPRIVEDKIIDRYLARFIQNGIKYDEPLECIDHLRRLAKNYDELSPKEKWLLDRLGEDMFVIVNNS